MLASSILIVSEYYIVFLLTVCLDYDYNELVSTLDRFSSYYSKYSVHRILDMGFSPILLSFKSVSPELTFTYILYFCWDPTDHY
jgi:ribosomal protein RSM22 (predicted rRNA methylase)